MRKTKIVATIGPASWSREVLAQLIDAGMDVARINFSHADYAQIEKTVRNIRSLKDNIPIVLDTKGPEIRTGKVADNLHLMPGDDILLTNREILGDARMITIRYKHLSNLKKGNVLLLDDGMLELEVIAQTKKGTKAKIRYGGLLSSQKSVSIRGHSVKIPFMSAKDKKDILFGIRLGFDFVAASFVRNKKDITQLRDFLKKHNSPMKIISKVEHWEAVDKIDEIIEHSDAVMVARGDLGVEVALERVPSLQKEIIKKCNMAGKPVIVATQMLESMRTNPKPTRAEVGDVANAILQGADAVMLSAESAAGLYPAKSVKMMARIAEEYDKEVKGFLKDEEDDNIAQFIAKAAFIGARNLNAKVILTPTRSGYTPRNVSRFKPQTPIVAVTPNLHVYRQLNLSWGVIPLLDPRVEKKLDHIIQDHVRALNAKKMFDAKDLIVVTSGYRVKKGGKSNLIEVYPAQDILSWKFS